MPNEVITVWARALSASVQSAVDANAISAAERRDLEVVFIWMLSN